MISCTKMHIFVCQCLGISSVYYMYSMIQYQEGFQNRSIIVIASIILLLVGFFSLGIRLVSADQSPQTHYKSGYIDGFKIAECDFKRCHSHGYDKTVPTGHTNQYNNGYSKGYHDGWNKASSDAGGKSQQSTRNGTSSINTTSRSEQIPNINDGCDPTHQFCAMTISTG